ncbi:phosphatase PAP2 family protein [Leadbetterella byssophila]|uniref:phosphatase PAP2 family protein n=1 Tax=Leadbetterella byssophila TaxID=316068 RepID=UPI0005A27C77|nr:phosphatase PAP2 family protein [Leadbetterella byssophila]
MSERISKALSYILHPVFIPCYLVIALKVWAPLPVFYLFMGDRLFLALFLLIFTYTVIIPLLFVFLQYKLKFISDYTLNNRRERPRVYLFTSGFYFATAYFLNEKGSVFMPTAVLFTAMGVNILGLFLFNFFDKISAHTSGLGGIVGIFFGIYYRYGDPNLIPVILSALILVGVLGSARLYLGAHNRRQIFLGAIWGFVTGFIGSYYFMKL